MMEVASGDIRKMSVLFERYHQKLNSYFLKTLMDQNLSKDLTQNVFEKMIKYRAGFKKDKSFKSWMFTIANNVMMDHFRKEKSMRTKAGKQAETKCKSFDPDAKMELDEQKQLLHQALDLLEPDAREILWLTRFERMKYAEIAVLKECTESAIKVKVHRAVKKLRTVYLQLENS